MKKLRFLALLWLVLCFASPQNLFAQAETSKGVVTFTITETKNKSSTPYTFEANMHQVMTPNGNFKKHFSIRIEKDHELMQDFGGYPNKLFEFNYLLVDRFGDNKYDQEDGDIVLTDAIAKLNKSGNLTITFHLNGAGTYLPLGW